MRNTSYRELRGNVSLDRRAVNTIQIHLHFFFIKSFSFIVVDFTYCCENEVSEAKKVSS